MHISNKCSFSWFLCSMSYLVHVVCTNSMILSISKVIYGWRFFCIAKLRLGDRTIKLKYVLIWLEDIDAYYFLYQSILIDLVVLISIMYGPCPKVLLCLWYDEMRFSISYEFYLKEFLNTYIMFTKSINFVQHFICLYAMNDTKGFVQDLQEVNCDGCTPRVPNLLGCGIWMWEWLRLRFTIYSGKLVKRLW